MNDEQPAVDLQQDLERPARKQVPGPVTHEPSRGRPGAGAVNIWSGRTLGPRQDGAASRGPARRQTGSAYRCDPVVDAGRTRGSTGNVNTFCIFFAKGMCYLGPECSHLHRLPTSADNAAMKHTTGSDIFGRDKLPDGLDNRKGAGSYERDMTTLYVHYGGAGHYAVPQLRHLLLQNFGAFGPVRSIHIVPAKTIAFIRYHWRVSAEFAREAMDQQHLTGSTLHEVLQVRWATDDPNPRAVIGRKRDALDAVEAAAMSAWDALPPEEKRMRIALAQQARAARVTQVASALPEPLMAAAGSGGDIPDDSFDAWRGFSGRQQQQVQQEHQGAGGAAAAAGSGPGGDGTDAAAQQGDAGYWQQVAADVSDDPQVAAAAAAQWDAYYASCAAQQQAVDLQQQGAGAGGNTGLEQEGVSAGSWYKGWRRRQLPDVVTSSMHDVMTGTATAAAAGDTGQGSAAANDADIAGGGAAAAGGLGLLAGYGSGSDSDEGHAA